MRCKRRGSGFAWGLRRGRGRRSGWLFRCTRKGALLRQRIEKERPGNYVLAWLNLLFVCECVDFARDAYARKAGTGGRCDSTTGEGGCARESVDIMLWHTV